MSSDFILITWNGPQSRGFWIIIITPCWTFYVTDRLFSNSGCTFSSSSSSVGGFPLSFCTSFPILVVVWRFGSSHPNECEVVPLWGFDLHFPEAPDNHDGVITDLEPDILECEVKWALESITTNKASGGDGIPVELFQILKHETVKVLHSICQQILKTQQWPQDWKRSFFIPIPK